MVLIFFINPSDVFLEKKGDRPPLGLMYLSSYIKQFNYTAKIWDLNHDSQQELEKNIISENPEFLCFSIAVTSYRWSVDFIKKIRKSGYSGKIIGGGNHITNIANDSEPQQYFDFLVIGDGELALKDILENKATNKIIRSPDIEDINLLPFPDYAGIDMDRYTMTVEGKKGAQLVSSRGCVFSCVYCGSAKIKKVRQRSPKNVLEEMNLLYDKYQIRGFYFGDDIFTLNFKRTIELCQLIKENLAGVVFRVTTRSDLLNY